MKARFFITLALALTIGLSSSAALRLPAYFSDNMVLQRNAELTIPVTATPGAKVSLEAGWLKKPVTATADAAGTALIKLKTPEASGPWTIAISEDAKAGKPEIELENVLIGEVWICSGQSNMEFPVDGSWAKVMNVDEVVAKATDPMVRLFHVARNKSYKPLDDLASEPAGGWTICSPTTVHEFSAVGYLFGKEISEALDVPVGLIMAAWGGTPAEAWSPLAALKGVKEFPAETQMLEQTKGDTSSMVKTYEKNLADWVAARQLTAEEQLTASGLVRIPGFFENTCVDPAWDGIIWVERKIDVPEKWAGCDMKLQLGPIDDEDITYFNGEPVGMTTGYDVDRSYVVPGHLVKAGENVLSIRIIDTGGDSGLSSKANRVYAISTNKEGKKHRINLSGDWQYNVIADFRKDKNVPTSVFSPLYPTVLYNAMIYPLHNLPVAGVIWYQGCANVGRADQYSRLFPALIEGWRKDFGQKDMPFYFVQLAGHMQPVVCQPASEWAALRQSQTSALRLSNVGMATAVDLGNPDDVHPRNKQDVAHRLALQALHNTYGKKDLVADAPKCTSAHKSGDKITLNFDAPLSPAAVVTGFIVGDKDGNWQACPAKVSSSKNVEIYLPNSLKSAKTIRYNWADYPCGNLRGADASALPITPFEKSL